MLLRRRNRSTFTLSLLFLSHIILSRYVSRVTYYRMRVLALSKENLQISRILLSLSICLSVWLPVKENVEFNILKLAHKSLYDKNSFPEYLKLSLHQVTAYNLRSSTAPVFSIAKESGTFQHSAARLDRLPIVIRNISDHNVFCRSAKKHFFAKYQFCIHIIIIVCFNIY